jgi:hypothetical protein
MASKWDNFLGNLGEWRGSFTTITAAGVLQPSSPSVLTLARGEGDGHVRFTLQRWSPGTPVAAGGGPGEGAGEPGGDIEQDYRSLGNQVVFFDSGAFNKGSMQVAPNTVFGGEFGFIHGNRRLRLVQLYTPEGVFEELVLIREFRAGSGASENPPTTADQLMGNWEGRSATISATWPEPAHSDCQIEIGAAEIKALRLSLIHISEPTRQP